MRTEYGFERVTCGCRLCQIPCEYMPGALAPPDIRRIAAALGYGEDVARFAEENLRASPGATVVYRGELLRIPTLVPAATESGACKFYVDGRCSIHDVAPYGCAFTDMHGAWEDRSRAYLEDIFRELRNPNGEYGKLVARLAAKSLVAPEPSEGRRRIREAEEKLEREKAGTE